MSAFQFQLFGRPVTVLPDVWLIVGFYVLTGLDRGDLVGSLTFAAAVFASILVHEAGHAVVAEGLGMGPTSITLHAFGGLTRHRPGPPARQLLVSLAGPGVGLLLGGLLWVSAAAWQATALEQLGMVMVSINIFWSLFNLLPMYPLDGGQALASVLLMRVPSMAWPITWGAGIVSALAVSVWALRADWPFLLIVAGLSALQNFKGLSAWWREPAPGVG